MEQKNNESREVIDLFPLIKSCFKELKRLWWIILILMVLGSGFMYLRTSRSYVPMYQAEAILSATVTYGSSTDLATSTYYYSNQAAEQAAASFPALLGSDVMKERLKLALNSDSINGSISSSSIAGTNFLVLTVSSSNPDDAYNILNAVIEVYPQISRLVIGDTQLDIASAPVLPTEPYNSFSWKSQVSVGALVGFTVGCVILFALALMNQTVSSPKEVQKLINLPCLTEIPYIKRKRRTKDTSQPLLLITTQEVDSAFREAFRLLRLKLLRQMKSAEEKVILVTSSLPAEGKSSVSINTALSLAREGKKVLLIDGDLRAQSVKTLLNLDVKSTGLMELLRHNTDNARYIPYPDTSLFILASDSTVDNPTPLLKYDSLYTIMQKLRSEFDYIIIDTPPCGMMADAAALSRHSDRIIYVIREDFAPRPQIVDGIHSMSGNNAQICGFVMNRSTVSHSSRYGYGYGYGYGKYGYGYKYGKDRYSSGKNQEDQPEE